MSQTSRHPLISVPIAHDALRRLDAAAAKVGLTRAGFVRRAVHAEVQRAERQRPRKKT
jgi:metal-responsive CopG/Arc/MetJ family transcriptional regulator